MNGHINSIFGGEDATATASDILTGKTAFVKGKLIWGSMKNNPGYQTNLANGGKYIIPAGYHSGTGSVQVSSLASVTISTASAGDIGSGKTAWVNGIKLTGTGMVSVPTTLTIHQNWMGALLTCGNNAILFDEGQVVEKTIWTVPMYSYLTVVFSSSNMPAFMEHPSLKMFTGWPTFCFQVIGQNPEITIAKG